MSPDLLHCETCHRALSDRRGCRYDPERGPVDGSDPYRHLRDLAREDPRSKLSRYIDEAEAAAMTYIYREVVRGSVEWEDVSYAERVLAQTRDHGVGLDDAG